MLGSAESEKVRLISREIIFTEFLPIIMITIPQRHRQTNRRTDGRTTCLGNTALRVASSGNKRTVWIVVLYSGFARFALHASSDI